MSFIGLVILGLILAILYSYVSQAKRPNQGPFRTPDEPEVTGVAVLLCHRLSEDRSRAEMTDDWAPARAKLVAGRWDDLGARRYAQVPRLNRWNVVFALLRVSRSWPVAVIGAILHGLPIPSRVRDASEQWDMIEVLEFADADSARCFLEGTTARSLAEDAAPWVQHAEAIPMIATRAYLGTHFAREATVTLFCLRARSEIGRTGMVDYWLDRHRPFVQGLRPLLNYAWYDQHIARGAEELEAPAKAYLPGHAPWDGVASIGYAHLRDMASGLLDVRVQLANMRLVNDETRFLDLPRSALLVGTVTCVLGDDPD